MYSAAKNDAGAAKHYLHVAHSYPQPARMHNYAVAGLNHLKKASPHAYVREMDRYIRKVGRVQELLPGLHYDLGNYYLAKRSLAVMAVRKLLVEQGISSRRVVSNAIYRPA